jgi:hypothetical protein
MGAPEAKVKLESVNPRTVRTTTTVEKIARARRDRFDVLVRAIGVPFLCLGPDRDDDGHPARIVA